MSYFRRLMMAQQGGNPYDFNGVDKYLDTGIKLWTGGDFTLLLTFTSRAVNAGTNQTILTTRNYGNTYGASLLHVAGTNFNNCTIRGTDSANTNALYSGSVIGVKKGFVLTRSGSKLYYRAVMSNTDTGLNGSSLIIAPSAAADDTLLLGATRLQNGLGEFWDGKIHALQYFYKYLSNNERVAWYQRNGL